MELFSVCISDFVLPLPIHPPNKDPEALHKPSAFPVFSDSLRSDPVSQILEVTAAFYPPILQCRQNCCNSVFRLYPDPSGRKSDFHSSSFCIQSQRSGISPAAAA